MLTAPIPATAKALAKSGLKISDIDLFEINEAFATVPLAWLKETGADEKALNPLGGAIAIGHPLGGSGAVLMTRLVHHMVDNGIKTAAFIGFADAYGEGWWGEFNKIAATKKLNIVASERYNRTDTSVTGQVLKLVAAKPDAVLIAGSGKFIGGGDQLASALRLSVPRLLAYVSAVVVVPLEFLVAALLLFGDKRTFEMGLVGSAALLAAFSAWMLSVLFRGLQVQCSCFGPSGAAVGWPQLARNALLVAIALTGLLVAPSGRDPVGTSVWSALALAAASVLIMFAVAVRRAVPALALSVEQVRNAYSQQGGDAYAR